jgi:hypothetical protein
MKKICSLLFSDQQCGRLRNNYLFSSWAICYTVSNCYLAISYSSVRSQGIRPTKASNKQNKNKHFHTSFHRHVDVCNGLPVAVRSLSSLQSLKCELMKLDLSKYLKACIGFARSCIVYWKWVTRKRQFSALVASVTLFFLNL